MRALIFTPITNFRETDAGHWLLAMTEDEHDPETNTYVASLVRTGQELATQTPQPVVETEIGAVDPYSDECQSAVCLLKYHAALSRSAGGSE